MTKFLQGCITWLSGQLTDAAATEAVYRAPDGTETDCSVLLFDLQTEQREVDGFDTTVTTQTCTFLNPTIDVQLRGLVIVDQVEWAVAGWLYTNASMVTVKLQRHELFEHGRSQYRRQT